jgi:2-amino-4-hydroxy-6-hydroxymethyldihydropteridine diphosphokinase
MTSYAFLGLGTNLGDREANLNKAIELISSTVGKIDSFSDVYETEPWGFQSENKFLNMVIRTRTDLKPPTLLISLLNIEDQLGRIRVRDQYASRTMDIDILLYNNKIINKPGLVIPHPMIRDRKFVLVPLCDIAPEMIHPVLKKTFTTLLQECTDEHKVRRVNSLSFPGGKKSQ